MPSGIANDFIIYDTQFFGGLTEILEQNATVFNGASQGAMNLVTRRMRGNFEQESYMRSIAGLVVRRDTTLADTAVADTPLVQAEIVGVKSNLRIGPIADTLDAFKKISADPGVFSLLLGRQIAPAIMIQFANAGLTAVAGAIRSQAPLVNDITAAATPTVTNDSLISTLALYGDAGNRVVAWVMHSKVFYDLMRNQVAQGASLFEIPGLVVRGGETNVPGLGRPIVVTDSPALVDAGAGPDYFTLGLTADALEVAESEERSIVTDIVTGQEQLKQRIQGEIAVNYKVKGYQWNIAAGGENPTDAALGTAANWTLASTDLKSTAGCVLQST